MMGDNKKTESTLKNLGFY
uniref:Uncharacterized protein n=1 Tax=Rhizophora mucronata TaxID=61149 RepID=A0A2P2N1Y6_RHIMU